MVGRWGERAWDRASGFRAVALCQQGKDDLRDSWAPLFAEPEALKPVMTQTCPLLRMGVSVSCSVMSHSLGPHGL